MDNSASRRSFLQSFGVGAAAWGLNSSALAQQKPIQRFEEAPTDANVSEGWKPVSDRKVRVGIVRYGVCRFGAAFSFQDHPNVDVVAVSDLFPDRCAGLAQACRCEKTYPSLEALVKDDSIEAVFVATDAPSHARKDRRGVIASISRTVSTVLVIIVSGLNVATASEVLVSNVEALKTAVAAASPGDSLIVRDGTYTDWRIKIEASGTATDPITFKAQTPGGVKFVGNVRVEISGLHLVVSGFRFEDAHGSRHASIVEFRKARQCRLTDCSFINCGDRESTFTRTINLAYESSHNRVDHCYMTGTLSMGMGVVVRASDAGRGNTDNRFDHNYFKDIERLSSNGQEPIQLGQDQTAFGRVSVRAVVEHNLFENASGDGEIISNKSADNIIRRNTLRDSKAGICLRGGKNVLVEGNYCCRTRAIRVFGEGHTIINNYLEETDDGICLDAGQYGAGEFVNREVSGSYQAASGVLVAHNTIVNPLNSGVSLGRNRGQKHGGVVRNELPRQITVINNLVTGARGVLVNDDGSHDVTWQTNIAWPRQEAKLGLSHTGILETDPLLVRSDGVRHLPGLDSPVHDAGTVLREVVADFGGRNRVGSPDIGCDEASDTGTVNKPLRPADVGPSWSREKTGKRKK